MKKFFAIAAVAVAFLMGSANAQVYVNLGGFSQSVLTSATIGNTTLKDSTAHIGFNAGGMFNYKIKGGLGIAAGAQISYVGYTDTLLDNSILGQTIKSSTKNTQVALEIPVMVTYSFPLGNALKLAVFAGPVVNYGLVHKAVTTTTTSGLINSTTTAEVNHYDADKMNDNVYSKLSLSAVAGLSATFNQWGVHAGYNFGATDILGQNDNATMNINRVFFGLSYQL